MDKSCMKDEKFYFGSLELTSLLIKMARSYQFMNKNKVPKAIFIPRIESIVVDKEVIPVEYEAEQPATASPVKPKRGKASASDSTKTV